LYCHQDPLNKLEHCDKCQGRGATKFENCHHCHGSGQVKRTQRTPFGLFQQSGPCPYCHGKGELSKDSCDKCGGELYRREDDSEESLRERLEIYHKDTELILNHYDSVKVNGDQLISKVTSDILEFL